MCNPRTLRIRGKTAHIVSPLLTWTSFPGFLPGARLLCSTQRKIVKYSHKVKQ